MAWPSGSRVNDIDVADSISPFGRRQVTPDAEPAVRNWSTSAREAQLAHRYSAVAQIDGS